MSTNHKQSLPAGLYFVATPIGTARDITLRGLDILQSADVLAAEDTRNTRHLMDIHGIALNNRPLIPYHDHNGPAQRPRLLALIAEGKSVAYVSDAGTPLIADPGFALSRDAIAAGHSVVSAPGASALLAALTVAGLPTDRFYFAGFLPPKSGARQAALGEISSVPGTLVFYESPKRLGKMLTDAAAILGGDRPSAVCRELTKKFEEVRRAPLGENAVFYASTPPRGEIVVLVGPAPERRVDEDMLDGQLEQALKTANSLKDAVAQVVLDTGLPRKQVYQRALALDRDR